MVSFLREVKGITGEVESETGRALEGDDRLRTQAREGWCVRSEAAVWVPEGSSHGSFYRSGWMVHRAESLGVDTLRSKRSRVSQGAGFSPAPRLSSSDLIFSQPPEGCNSSLLLGSPGEEVMPLPGVPARALCALHPDWVPCPLVSSVCSDWLDLSLMPSPAVKEPPQRNSEAQVLGGNGCWVMQQQVAIMPMFEL